MNITFVGADGARKTVTVHAGLSVMEVALQYGLDGIDAECGGGCACGTCHVYIDDNWLEVMEPPSEVEAEMLKIVQDLRATSRLACQIKLTNALNGLIVTIPEINS